MSAGLGHSVRRVEDRRFLTGRGRYTADIDLPGQAHAVLLRSPHAAASIEGIDKSAAQALPGVIAILTGDALLDDGISDLPCLAQLTRRSGDPMFKPPHPALAREAVHHVGAGVAMVVAESAAAAQLGAEAVEVAYTPKPAVACLADIGTGAAAVWADCPDNSCFDFEAGDADAVERAFAAAAHVTALEFSVNRVAPAPMEPRAAIGVWNDAEERFTLYSGCQNPHSLRRVLATRCLGIAESGLRVVSPDLGGGFGMRSDAYAELVLVLWAARKLGRPIKWTGTRSEAFVADNQARDHLTTVELALDRDGSFLALRVKTKVSLGAYLSLGGPTPTILNVGGLAGVYTTPAIHVAVTGYFTNTPSTAPYRGAGRPEASYAIERVIDTAARELGIDRIDLRRRNTIAPTAMPFKTALTFTYDSGEFERNMDSVLALANYESFDEHRTEAARRGALRGFGIANVVERAAAAGEEAAEIRFSSTGSVTLLVGTHSHGQGHETVFRQLLVDRLGLPFESVRFVQGDTDKVAHGFGTFGSRSSGLGSAAIVRAADKIIDKGKRIVAHEFEVAAGDVEFDDGRFTVAGTDMSRDIFEVAARAYQPAVLPPDIEPGLFEHGAYAPLAATYPNGCHACEVEIDPDTGQVRLIGYWVVDDVGTVMNPMLVEGQIHGGVAQGAGQALIEDVAWDAESGQPLTGSFLDYALPRAGDLPAISADINEVPTPMNPLGIKGAGEAGTIGALPCVMNAVCHALAPLGVRAMDMPATPERVWRAIRAAREQP